MIINVGADPFPPYQYYENGVVVGMDCDIVKAAFEIAGYKPSVQLKDWPAIQKDYAEGKVQCLFQVQPTEERKTQNTFSSIIRNAVTQIVTAEMGLEIGTFADLRDSGIHIGVMEAYSYGDPVDVIPSSSKRSYATQEDLLQAISDGKERIGVFDRGVRLFLQKQLGIQNLKVLDSLSFYRPLAVMFHLGDEAIRDAFNEGLEVIQTNGTYESIIRRWEPTE